MLLRYAISITIETNITKIETWKLQIATKLFAENNCQFKLFLFGG